MSDDSERFPQILEWEVRLTRDEFDILQTRIEAVINDYLDSLGLQRMDDPPRS